MKALILAAGIGQRLKSNLPKILLKVGKKSLLERHYENLIELNVKNIGIVIGYKSQVIKKYIKKIDKGKNITIFQNKKYKNGSIVSFITAGSFIMKKGNMLLMDGDVFYDKKILQKVVNSKKKNCLLIDKNFEKGVEPVKVCIKKKIITDFGKIVDNKDNDIQSESVGFFKFTNKLSAKLLFEAKKMMLKNPNYMYEDVIQKMIKEKKIKLDFENITNLPWIEIDYKKDLKKARKNILKKIND